MVDLKERDKFKPTVPIVENKKKIFGRHLEIHELVVFLTQDQEKVYALNGERQCRSDLIAQHCIRYVMDRYHFDDGAYQINVYNQFSTEEFLKTLSRELKLLSPDQNDIIDMLKK